MTTRLPPGLVSRPKQNAAESCLGWPEWDTASSTRRGQGSPIAIFAPRAAIPAHRTVFATKSAPGTFA